jgi:NodT family efflux transporter outer membrane factor (OMF) lipoprotein
VGPRFQKPQPPVNKEWSGAASPLIEVRSAPDSAWWTLFGDTTLNRLVGIAYRQNLPLQIAGLRILEARAQLAIAMGQQYPQLQVLTGEASAVQISENTASGVVFDRNHVQYNLGFDAAWEVDFWGKFRYDVQAQSANLFATAADYDDALVSLIAEVARTYTMIRTFEELLEQSRRNAALQEDGLRIADARFRNGAAPELDVAQATTLLEGTRRTIPQLEMGLQQSLNALSILLGRPPGSLQGLLQGARGIPATPPKVPVSLPAELLSRRPDVRNAEFMAAAQNARVGVAKADYYPRFVLFGSVGLQASEGVAGSSANLFDPGSLYYAVGPRLVWPILNYGRIGNSVRVQDARLQQLLVNYEATVLRAAREVEDGMIGFVKSRDAAVFAQNAAASAQRSVDLSMVQYREGAVDYQRVLDAQRSLLAEQDALTRARSDIATNLIALYKALGGGWELRRGQQVVPDSVRAVMQERTNWGKMLAKPAPEAKPATDAPADASKPEGR